MDENAKKQLGQRIKAKREELEMSQLELAKSVKKTSPAYIAFIEAGERNVSAVDLMLMAKNLGSTVSELMGENSSKNVEPMQVLRADKNLNLADRKKVAEYYNLLLKNQNENKK